MGKTGKKGPQTNRKMSATVKEKITSDTKITTRDALPASHRNKGVNDSIQLLKRFRYDKSSVAPSGIVALVCCGLSAYFPTIADRYFVCPQEAAGWHRAAVALAITIPIGVGLITLVMIALSLALPSLRTERSTTTIRKLSEWAALGAILGTFPAALSGIRIMSGGPRETCKVDLMQTMGNGAMWGTLWGFAIGLIPMIRSLLTDASDTKSAWDKLWIILTICFPLLWGAAHTISLITAFNKGLGWPGGATD